MLYNKSSSWRPLNKAQSMRGNTPQINVSSEIFAKLLQFVIKLRSENLSNLSARNIKHNKIAYFLKHLVSVLRFLITLVCQAYYDI